MAKEKFLVWTETNGVTCTGKGKEDSSKLPFFTLVYSCELSIVCYLQHILLILQVSS